MGFLDNKQNKEAFDNIIKKAFPKDYQYAGGQLNFILFGGQPGAGKSVVQKILKKSIKDIVILDIDSYRKHHPDYEKIKKESPNEMPVLTNEFVYSMLLELKEYAFKNKYPIAIENTFYDKTYVQNVLDEAKQKGYSTELHVLAVHPTVSYLSTLNRFQKGAEGSIGRNTPKELHFDRAGKNEDVLKYCIDNRIADSFHLYKRKITIDKTETSVKRSPLVTKWEPQPTNILEAFIQERTRLLNREERICYSIIANDLIKKMESKEVSKSEIETFKKDLKQILNPDPDKNISKGLKR